MKKKINFLIKHPFVQGSFLYTIGGLFISLINYLFNLFVGRALGPKGYSEIAALLSYIIIFGTPLSIFSTIIIQKIAGTEQNRLAYAAGLQIWFKERLKKWWPFFLLCLIPIPFLPRLTNLGLYAATILIPLTIISFLTYFYGAVIQGMELFLLFILVNILYVLIKFLGAVIVSFGFGNINTVISFLALSTVVTLVVHYLIVRKQFNQLKQPPFNIKKNFSTVLTSPQFIFTGISIITLTLLNNLDIIFAKKFFVPTVAGLYSSWSLCAKIILYLISPLVSVGLIFFSNKNNASQQKIVMFFTLTILFMVAGAIYTIYSVFPMHFLNLIFGNRFSDISGYLRQAAIFGFFYTAISLLNNFFMAKKNISMLILAFFFPFYLICIFLFGKSLPSLININIYFSVTVAICYFSAFLFYNTKNES